MSDHCLKLNADKTEFVLIVSAKKVAEVQHFELTISDSPVRPSASDRYEDTS